MVWYQSGEGRGRGREVGEDNQRYVTDIRRTQRGGIGEEACLEESTATPAKWDNLHMSLGGGYGPKIGRWAGSRRKPTKPQMLRASVFILWILGVKFSVWLFFFFACDCFLLIILALDFGFMPRDAITHSIRRLWRGPRVALTLSRASSAGTVWFGSVSRALAGILIAGCVRQTARAALATEVARHHWEHSAVLPISW